MKTVRIINVVFTSLIITVSCFNNVFAQIDSEAVTILDNMSNSVTDLESCTFTLKTQYDVFDDKLGLVKLSEEANVYLKAPDKLLVYRKGDRGSKNYFYDGKSFTYYSDDNNQYATIPAPGTIMETIDSIHNEYGIEFPAADIFYDDIVDYIIDEADILSNLGITMIDNKECMHVAGANDEISFQIWITNDESFLPLKLSLVYKSKPGNPQYEAIFQNWSLNPYLNDSMFNFIVPEYAKKIKFSKKN